MLDVGWTEILVIAIVLIIVVGPKDLPQMLRTFGRMVSKMRGMASDFRQQFDEALREADLDDVRKTPGDDHRGFALRHGLRYSPVRFVARTVRRRTARRRSSRAHPPKRGEAPDECRASLKSP